MVGVYLRYIEILDSTPTPFPEQEVECKKVGVHSGHYGSSVVETEMKEEEAGGGRETCHAATKDLLGRG